MSSLCVLVLAAKYLPTFISKYTTYTPINVDIYKNKNWDKYQSADKYELVKEQNRERQKRFRENQKNGNNVNVTLR